MNNANRIRLLKVLALADSSHDGEAVAAVRAARQLLAQDGMSFADLANGAVDIVSLAQDNVTQLRSLEVQVTDLQRRLLDALRQLHDRNQTLTTVNSKLQLLEQNAEKTKGEVEKWRNLARDTANKLWDIGQQIAEDRAVTHTVAGQLEEIRPTPRSLNRPIPPTSALGRERVFVRNSLRESEAVEAESRRSAGK
ncbi:MAG: hypothetical protein KBA75_00625 [Alphaproteobacteria bacterium]|nr:hypothetical protein [Alphaproteobacteria bacterium]